MAAQGARAALTEADLTPAQLDGLARLERKLWAVIGDPSFCGGDPPAPLRDLVAGGYPVPSRRAQSQHTPAPRGVGSIAGRSTANRSPIASEVG